MEIVVSYVKNYNLDAHLSRFKTVLSRHSTVTAIYRPPLFAIESPGSKIIASNYHPEAHNRDNRAFLENMHLVHQKDSHLRASPDKPICSGFKDANKPRTWECTNTTASIRNDAFLDIPRSRFGFKAEALLIHRRVLAPPYLEIVTILDFDILDLLILRLLRPKIIQPRLYLPAITLSLLHYTFRFSVSATADTLSRYARLAPSFVPIQI